jgi:uncharacterized protein YcgI (DUF1989 family)
METGSDMTQTPPDAEARRAIAPVICYPNETLPRPDLALYRAAREGAEKIAEVVAPPREAACFRVAAGQFFRITSVDGPQVGDLNLWNAHDLSERFYSGMSRRASGSGRPFPTCARWRPSSRTVWAGMGSTNMAARSMM